MLKGKLEEAEVIFKRIAEVNGKEMPKEPIHQEPDVRMGDLRDLFSSKKMAHKALLSSYVWWVHAH